MEGTKTESTKELDNLFDFSYLEPPKLGRRIVS